MKLDTLSAFLHAAQTAALFLALAGLGACGGSGGGSTPPPDPAAQNQIPAAVAGTDLSTESGETVMFSGIASSDQDGDALTFNWTQIAGAPEILAGANTATATFTAPETDEPATLATHLEWDHAKNQAKHGLSFEIASHVFEEPFQRALQDRHENGEERWQNLSVVASLVILLVAQTVREDDGAEIIRIISARQANSWERERYEQARAGRAGSFIA